MRNSFCSVLQEESLGQHTQCLCQGPPAQGTGTPLHTLQPSCVGADAPSPLVNSGSLRAPQGRGPRSKPCGSSCCLGENGQFHSTYSSAWASSDLLHPTLGWSSLWVGAAGQLLSRWSRAGMSVAIYSCHRCKELRNSLEEPGG